MADVLARMTAIMEEQQEQRRKQGLREELEDLSTADARKASRHIGATGVAENNFPPEISNYNKKGERDNPRPELRCKMIWVGINLTKEMLTREEIELVNQVQPGDYRVTKADNSTIEFTVEGKVDRAGKPELLRFHFPCKHVEDRQNHMPMTSYLREVLNPEKQEEHRSEYKRG